MKISIALASYNGSRFIAEQLASFANQSRLPDELVVCDDRSSDETVSIVQAFALSAPFAVRIERNPSNLGFNGNFERVLSLCTGDLIFISDQDDIWYPEKIERASMELEARPELLALINDEHIGDGEGRPTGPTFLGNVRKLGYPDSNHVAGCCTVLRRALLPLLLPFPKEMNYDSWTATFTDLLSAKAYLDVPLQLYRRHGSNTTETVLAKQDATQWDLVRTYGLADPRGEWRKQIDQFDLFRNRIEERRELAISLLGEARVATALRRIDGEADRLSKRLAVLSKSRAARLPAVLKLWSRGFYADFAGGKSALKDIIRA